MSETIKDWSKENELEDVQENFIYDIWLKNYYLDPRDLISKRIWDMNPRKPYKIKECIIGRWPEPTKSS